MKKTKNTWGQIKKQYINFDLVEEYYLAKTEDEAVDVISERTLKDLDFPEFFKFLDRTTSDIGQQYLYNQLRRLKTSKESLAQLEQRIEFYSTNQPKRQRIQKVLISLSKGEDYYFPFLLYGALPIKWRFSWVVSIIQLLVGLCIIASIFLNPIFFLGVVAIFSVNVGLHYWHKNRIGNFATVFSRLITLTRTSKDILEDSHLLATEKEELEKNIKEVDSITNKLHWLKMDSLQNNEYLILFWFLIEITKIVSLSEISTFHAVVDKIGSSRKAIEQLYLFIGELDMAISIASLRAGLPYYSQATFLSNQKELQVQSLYHPLVENCVANELHLKGKSLLLTGSNMSGKSTFIKAINLNLIAAQTINTSFTKAYTAPILGIATSIEISDDITSAKSYYMEEVETIGNLMELSNKPNSQFLFTIDEVFKGTNTIERISAAKAILSFLNQKQHLVLVSTHDIELTELLDEYYDLYYFQESIENQNLSFDYTLKQGALKKKNAIAILELAGYPPTVIQEAKSIANKFEKEKLLYKKDI